MLSFPLAPQEWLQVAEGTKTVVHSKGKKNIGALVLATGRHCFVANEC